LAAAKPGATCEEVEAAWRGVIARHGIERVAHRLLRRLQLSAGLGRAHRSLRPGDKTVLQPNMTFHCIPAIWMADWGIEISECFRVTERAPNPSATCPGSCS
jgi:Xaa-Pro aminopeptidase